MPDIRHPEIVVVLPHPSSELGTSFGILWLMEEAFKRHDVPYHERREFILAATENDFIHLMATCQAWVTVHIDDDLS